MIEVERGPIDADKVFEVFLRKARINQLGSEATTAVTRLEPSSVEWLRTVARLVYPIRKRSEKMVRAENELLKEIARVRTDATVSDHEKTTLFQSAIEAEHERDHSRVLDDLGRKLGYRSIAYQTELLRVIIRYHLLKFISDEK